MREGLCDAILVVLEFGAGFANEAVVAVELLELPLEKGFHRHVAIARRVDALDRGRREPVNVGGEHRDERPLGWSQLVELPAIHTHSLGYFQAQRSTTLRLSEIAMKVRDERRSWLQRFKFDFTA